MNTKSSIKEIPPAEVHAQAPAPIFLDVRSPAEHQEIHIEGSALHPLGQWDAKELAQQLGSDQPCVVVCRSGNRARQAAEKLAAEGMTNLSVLAGGVLAWESEGFAVNRGKKTISLERQVRIAAGSLVLLGVLLGFFVHPGFYILSGFVGAGLVFAGVTDTCGMGLLLARMPWNTRGAGPSPSQCKLNS